MRLTDPRVSCVVATVIVAAYTAVVWWVGHPLVRSLVRAYRRDRR